MSVMANKEEREGEAEKERGSEERERQSDV